MAQIDSPIGSVVFDLDGVVYLGSTPIPGAAQVIESLIRDRWQVLFATNNSTTTPAMIVEVLASRTGLVVEPETIITSGMAASAHLVDDGVGTAFVVGSSQLAETVRERGISTVDHLAAESVVVGLDRSFTYDTIAKAATAIRRGAAFIATNTDVTFPTPTGLVPGAGTIVAAIRAASGVDPVVCGKPHDPMVRLLDHVLETDRVWMVGDRPETDIAFAKAAGWRSVLTLTGVTSGTTHIPVEFTPDHVVGSLTDLEAVLGQAVGTGPDEG